MNGHYPKQFFVSGGTYQIGYTQKIYKRISIETGLGFIHHSIKTYSGGLTCGTGKTFDILSQRIYNAYVPLALKVNILPQKITENWTLNMGLGINFNKLKLSSEVRMYSDDSVQEIITDYPRIFGGLFLPVELSRKITSGWWAGLYYQAGGAVINNYSPQSISLRLYYKIR